MSKLSPFHLAIPVHDLAAAREFYGRMMGCEEGRSSARWVDFNFLGHQLVCHLDDDMQADVRLHNEVDRVQVPVPHFGVVVSKEDWQYLADRFAAFGADFLVEPRVRFRGTVGEQATFFVRDPSGNALEFKAMADPERLFARDAPDA